MYDETKAYNVTNGKIYKLDFAIQVKDLMDNSKKVLYIIVVLGFAVAFRIFCGKVKFFESAYYPMMLLMAILSGLTIRACSAIHLLDLQMLNPNVFIFAFLPVLLFHNAFLMDYHGFRNSIGQVFLITLVGNPMQIAFLAVVFHSVLSMNDNQWSYEVAIMFSIVCCLIESELVFHELHKTQVRTKNLQLLLQGERLVTFVLGTYFYWVTYHYHYGIYNSYWFFLLTFLWHMLGLVFGIVLGSILDYVFVRIPVDCLVAALTLTVFAAFFSFFIGQTYMNMAGVVATVSTGVFLSPTKVKSASTVEANITYLWNWLAYVFNTTSYVVPGLIVGLYPDFLTLRDIIFIIIIYVIAMCCRCLFFVVSRPILNKLGNFLKWAHISILVVGPYRAAPAILLSLVYREYNPVYGHQVLTYIALLSLVSTLLNSFLLPSLLNLHNMYDLTHARAINMQNAVRHVVNSRNKAILSLKMDRIVADANWLVVQSATKLQYQRISVRRKEAGVGEVKLTDTGMRHTFGEEETQGTSRDMSDLEHEARQRIINVQQVSLWKQYEMGTIAKKSVRTLASMLQGMVDKQNPKLMVEELELSWVPPKWIKNIKRALGCLLWYVPKRYAEGTSRWRNVLITIFNHLSYRLVSTCIVLVDTWFILNLALYNHWPGELHVPMDILRTIEFFFYFYFLLEFVLLVTAIGHKEYFKKRFNQVDFTCSLVVRTVDVTKSLYTVVSEADRPNRYVFSLFLTRYILLLRLNRCYVILEVLLDKFWEIIEIQMDSILFQRYDIGKGYLVANDQVLKYLKQIVQDKKIYQKLRKEIEEDRKKISKALGVIQKERPNVAVTVKTRHAIKQVINEMNESITDIYDEGLLDDIEKKVLIQSIDQAKKIMRSLKLISPCSPEYILKDVTWLSGEGATAAFLLEHARLHSFSYEEVIIDVGDDPAGVFILISGLVKCVYKPFRTTIANLKKNGALPNCDFLVTSKLTEPQEDYIVSGNVIGELGAVTGRRYDMTVICESEVQVYYIPRHCMFKVLFGMHNSKRVFAKVWRSIGIKIALLILQYEPSFQGWLKEKTLLYLEKSFVPILTGIQELHLNDLVAEIILIEGKIMDGNTMKEMIAPLHIPKTVSLLILPGTKAWPAVSQYETRLLIVPSKHADEEDIMSSQGILQADTRTSQHIEENIDTKQKSKLHRRMKTGNPSETKFDVWLTFVI